MSEKRSNSLYILFIVIFVAILLVSTYMLMYVPFDTKQIAAKSAEMREKLNSGPLQSLLNGSGINNIPNLKILTTNTEIQTANKCSEKPLFVGKNTTKEECIRICANSSANVINVGENETYIYEQQTLSTGAYCTIGPRPECNTKTSIPMMTVNSITCRSKYPRFVGGSLGTTIVACNNSTINDPKNVLWDYKYQVPFDPLTTVFTRQNERMPGRKNRYRFRCKFNGVDERNNRYIPHPYNRLHPIRNYCASSIYRAHPDVRTIYDYKNSRFRCDCGDPEVTRVTNLTEDPSSICSHLKYEIKDDVLNRKSMTVPFKCFTLYSTVDDVGKMLPCNNDQFTREGSQMSSATIQFTQTLDELTEHPVYEKLTNKKWLQLRPGHIVT